MDIEETINNILIEFCDDWESLIKDKSLNFKLFKIKQTLSGLNAANKDYLELLKQLQKTYEIPDDLIFKLTDEILKEPIKESLDIACTVMVIRNNFIDPLNNFVFIGDFEITKTKAHQKFKELCNKVICEELSSSYSNLDFEKWLQYGFVNINNYLKDKNLSDNISIVIKNPIVVF